MLLEHCGDDLETKASSLMPGKKLQGIKQR